MLYVNLQKEPITTGLLYKLYGATAAAALPLATVGLLFSARGRRRLGERFGDWGSVGGCEWWLHGASVGEVQGLLPFIRDIRAEHADSRIFLTTTSPTGLERAADLVHQGRLLPLDAPVLVRRALARVNCARFVVSETELWPSLLTEVQLRGIPCHMINARISDYTSRWYRLLRPVFTPILRRFSSISVPDEEQRERFVSLGVDSGNVYVTGHTKYDAQPKFLTQGAKEEARQLFFPRIDMDMPVIVLGSLREGEERLWFSSFRRAWEVGMSFRVIVAPRHAERFDFFWREIVSLNRRAVRWSSGDTPASEGHEIILLDTMGTLEQAYVAADLAFVGATLVDIGGHNPFEPAMYRVPVVVGPYTSVIRQPVSLMRDRSGILEVSNERDIFEVLSRLAAGDARLREVGERAFAVYAEQAGASARVLNIIRSSEAKGSRIRG